MTVAIWVLWSLVAVASVTGAAVAAWRLGQLARLARRTPSWRRHGTPSWPRISIIVPARDEAANLPSLLVSLQRLDPAPAEIIVVDDHSTDGTGDLARAAGATVLTPPPLPAGWLGKAWACHAGAAAATGDLLLFTDADTVHGPASLGDAVAALDADRADLLSAVPSHRVVSWWEHLQGVFHLLLLVACRAGAASARGRRRFSIGQYLLFRRDAYDHAGGHAALRGEIAEDLALAERITDRGGRFALLARPGTVLVRMYPDGLASFLRGWRRSFRAGLRAVGGGGGAEMVAVMGWLLGVPMALVAAVIVGSAPAIVLWTGAYVATAVAIARTQRAVGVLPWWSALAYPAIVLLFAGVSAAAAFDHLRGAPVRWRGRTVQL